MAGVLARLNMREKGENFRDAVFRPRRDREPTPGWTLPASWDAETYDGQNHAGVPTLGHLTLWYVTNKHDVDKDHVEETERYRVDLRNRFFKLGLPRPLPASSSIEESGKNELLVPRDNRSSVRVRGKGRRKKGTRA